MSKPQDVPPDLSPHSQTILVVDDERMVRELVCKILRLRGYTVLEASHGVEALRICLEHAGPIHLLLTDIFMPEMNGRTLAERVTAQRPHIRVLYMSTDATPITHLSLRTETAFIQKPFTPDALARRVRKVLDATE
ncbi:MAG: response regulator [Nitrospiraceae bacterium]